MPVKILKVKMDDDEGGASIDEIISEGRAQLSEAKEFVSSELCALALNGTKTIKDQEERQEKQKRVREMCGQITSMLDALDGMVSTLVKTESNPMTGEKTDD